MYTLTHEDIRFIQISTSYNEDDHILLYSLLKNKEIHYTVLILMAVLCSYVGGHDNQIYDKINGISDKNNIRFIYEYRLIFADINTHEINNKTINLYHNMIITSKYITKDNCDFFIQIS